VDEQLKTYGATNLIVYLDGVLRYLPLPDLLGKDKDKQSPASPNNTRADFRDAYRWGPFIMIGNWR